MNGGVVEAIDWQKCAGLIPAVIQDSRSLQVLMLGYMNQQALLHTLESKRVTFWSRTKQRLWMKGESSGHILKLCEMSLDCDGDTLLIQADPVGPTCHKGSVSCFSPEAETVRGLGFLGKLEQIIDSRREAAPGESYTAALFDKGVKRIAQKVGEEGVEVALAATAGDREELISESADLLFHLLALLKQQGLSLDDVGACLAERHLES
ncbi:bifunctional phosphoribosyl-AMP cyclohydrolase/phosphoribosyl-ATP diphosphatase HisIE [Dongshaea marina]|uniref:bifunctional phosphoribosyl-AMP cyclohydrolase/phosphoribosyl-ATP diphosphatase HisIE n=1 Tax=Dongshaea marina TaxID=2047966 RepID=UPI000D3E99C5|nr:bifunctional phosphoribosyl-AMP cyclohydrolase/phosphoribosyl-ATP diphosphatase HisIE [Dongshaea marina]